MNRLVISDFGAALEISEERVTRTSDALLSFGYAAPEQLKIGRTVDPRADQFSLTITIWELLTGEFPVGSFPKLKRSSTDAPFWSARGLPWMVSISASDSGHNQAGLIISKVRSQLKWQKESRIFTSWPIRPTIRRGLLGISIFRRLQNKGSITILRAIENDNTNEDRERDGKPPVVMRPTDYRDTEQKEKE